MSTASRMKVEGMNCVWPKAPAQEPTRWAGLTSPSLDDLQRRDQLAAKIGRVLAVAGERRERLHQGTLADGFAEIGFDAPDGDHDMAIDAEARFDRIERRAPLRQHGSAVRDALIIDESGEIIPDRRLELGLLLLQVEHGPIGGKPARLRIEGRCGDALGFRLRPHALQAGGEILFGMGRGQDGKARELDRSEKEGGEEAMSQEKDHVRHGVHLRGAYG